MTNQNYFIGDYVNEIRENAIAAVVSGQNIVLIGSPGYGKTAIIRDVVERMADGVFSFTRLDPTTPVEIVSGAYDPAALLNGELKRVVDGTPYEPGNRIAIIDEIFRASEPMFDKLLDVCDRKDVSNGDAPAVIATTNFIVESERTEALLDRFAGWVWVQTDDIDMAAIVNVHLKSNGKPTTPGDVPDWNRIEFARNAEIDDDTAAVVTRFIMSIADAATLEGRRPHPRRLAQWSHIIYRVSVFEHGTATFDTVPPMARRIMRYLWPNTTIDMAAEWKLIVNSAVDPVGGAVDAILADAIIEFRRVANTPAAERPGELNGLGAFNIAQQQTLRQLAIDHGDDDRIETAIQQMTGWFGLAASGLVDNIS